MANINASALNSLQTRINAERSRRSLSPVTFTDGTLSAGGTIKATHFAELRTYTAGLDTLGSQTFNWSGTVSVGASITDVITQINNFVTTLEGEALASWHTLSPLVSLNATWISWHIYEVPEAAWAAGNVQWLYTDNGYPYSGSREAMFVTLLRTNINTIPSTNFQGGVFTLRTLQQNHSTNGHHIADHSLTAHFKPWGNEVGADVSTDQSPYELLEMKGTIAGGLTPNMYNANPGVVLMDWGGNSTSNAYYSKDNHWYNNNASFDSNYRYIFVFNQDVIVPYDVSSRLQLQAYY